MHYHSFPSYACINGFIQISLYRWLFYSIVIIKVPLATDLDLFLNHDTSIQLQNFCLFTLLQTFISIQKYLKSNKTWKTGQLFSSHFLNQRQHYINFTIPLSAFKITSNLDHDSLSCSLWLHAIFFPPISIIS